MAALAIFTAGLTAAALLCRHPRPQASSPIMATIPALIESPRLQTAVAPAASEASSPLPILGDSRPGSDDLVPYASPQDAAAAQTAAPGQTAAAPAPHLRLVSFLADIASSKGVGAGGLRLSGVDNPAKVIMGPGRPSRAARPSGEYDEDIAKNWATMCQTGQGSCSRDAQGRMVLTIPNIQMKYTQVSYDRSKPMGQRNTIIVDSPVGRYELHRPGAPDGSTGWKDAWLTGNTALALPNDTTWVHGCTDDSCSAEAKYSKHSGKP
jgi:hypothetical protein